MAIPLQSQLIQFAKPPQAQEVAAVAQGSLFYQVSPSDILSRTEQIAALPPSYLFKQIIASFFYRLQVCQSVLQQQTNGKH
jgi:hypothetical protein